MRGDILLKANHPSDAAEAYSKAMSLDPVKSGLLQVSYGQALLNSGNPASVKKAVAPCRWARSRQGKHGRLRVSGAGLWPARRQASAELALAEGHYYSGEYKDAKIFAARAQQKLKPGSPPWIRAQDIINYRAPSKKK